MVKYNLSDIEIFALFVNQNNECPGCKRSLDTVRFCIDHNHETGKVRGVLCDACNTAIGMAREKREVLENLSSYLISNGE